MAPARSISIPCRPALRWRGPPSAAATGAATNSPAREHELEEGSGREHEVGRRRRRGEGHRGGPSETALVPGPCRRELNDELAQQEVLLLRVCIWRGRLGHALRRGCRLRCRRPGGTPPAHARWSRAELWPLRHHLAARRGRKPSRAHLRTRTAPPDASSAMASSVTFRPRTARARGYRRPSLEHTDVAEQHRR